MAIFNISVRGSSHIEADKECQDSSLSFISSDRNLSIVAVADGHGGDRYFNSATGARIACEVAIDMLKTFFSNSNPASLPDLGDIHTLIRSIVANWTINVEKDNKGDIKSYGCTLIAYAQSPLYWLALQIGDGRCSILNQRNKWRQPVPWDDKCFLNFTTSLCDENAVKHFRWAAGRKIPKAIFLCTDGVDGTFGNGNLLYNFYNRILKSLKDEGNESVTNTLPTVLSHYSKIGSKDDMSLAVIYKDSFFAV